MNFNCNLIECREGVLDFDGKNIGKNKFLVYRLICILYELYKKFFILILEMYFFVNFVFYIGFLK